MKFKCFSILLESVQMALERARVRVDCACMRISSNKLLTSDKQNEMCQKRRQISTAQYEWLQMLRERHYHHLHFSSRNHFLDGLFLQFQLNSNSYEAIYWEAFYRREKSRFD